MSRRMALLRMLLLLAWLMAIGGGTAEPSSNFELSDCPRCDMLFSMVETSLSGERVQRVATQERGEPKSGTTFMYVWGHGALAKTCDYLNEWFGSESCSMHDRHDKGPSLEKANQLVFNPRLGAADAKCPCVKVDRVEITLSFKDKHKLPVQSGCRYDHVGTIAVQGAGCLTVDGQPVENYAGIERCMEEANCTIIDDRLQFVVMRDPRAQAVSTFYHEIVHDHLESRYHWIGFGLNTVDEFVMATLPTLCQWLTIRYYTFAVAMEKQSTLFWYTDTFADPAHWHADWSASVGVHLPTPVVEEMATAATNDQFGFITSGKNEHPGEVSTENKGEDEQEDKESHPTWKSEISAELMGRIDDIMRKWLPPALLARFELSQ